MTSLSPVTQDYEEGGVYTKKHKAWSLTSKGKKDGERNRRTYRGKKCEWDEKRKGRWEEEQEDIQMDL